MTETDFTASTLDRVPTGVPGLDAMLNGGFFRGGVYMFLARPGSGKTILGSQICFRHVAAGGRAVVVTLLSESQARMIAQLKTLSFFEPLSVGSTLSYVAGYQTLEKEGLKGLLALIRKVVRSHKATLLMIDGFVPTQTSEEIETKKFAHELQVFSELVGCTTLLLTGKHGAGEQYALRTMVDGLLDLRVTPMGMEAARTIQVSKFRGSQTLVGRHIFEITDAGITIYPRTESLRSHGPPRPERADVPLASVGIKSLDAMLGGGLRDGSITLILGAPGSGKTLVGLSFLEAGAKLGERGLYFGFFETPSDLSRKASAIGLGLADHVKGGVIEVIWEPPPHAIADALAGRLLAAIRERGIRRVFIDGLGAFTETLVYRDRSQRFFGALCEALRSTGVIAAFSDETRGISVLETPEPGMTAMLDNVITLRHVELRSRLHKLVAVTKMREGGNDPSVREFSIGAQGFVVSPASDGASFAPMRASGAPLPARSRKPAKKSPKRR